MLERWGIPMYGDHPATARSTAGTRLGRILEREFRLAPLDKWGFLFPGHVAAWRFIEGEEPGVLGPLVASYDREPVFEGEDATWITSELIEDEEYLSLLEEILREVVEHLPADARGRVAAGDALRLSEERPERLAETVLNVARRRRSEQRT